MDKELFERLINSAEQMVAIEKGELEVSPENIHRFRIPNTKKIRTDSHLKQDEFAKALGVSKSLVQSWETQRRIPNSSSLKLLFLLEKQPGLIDELRAL